MKYINYYNILEVSPQASSQEIKLAYRKLAKQWHPDKNKSDQAKLQFQTISEAYQTLSDSQLRQAYDLSNWGFDSFIQDWEELQTEISQMMEMANQKRQQAHQQWMNDFDTMWANAMATS